MTQQKIYLIRHGETAWTISGQHTGRSDIPLTEGGREQAVLLGKRIKNLQFAKVFTCPLQRNVQTCSLCGLLDVAEMSSTICEWNYGKYEGMTTPEIQKIDPGWSIFSKGAPGGESFEDIEKRVKTALSMIMAVKGDVIVFSSGHFSRALASGWLGQNPSFGRFLFLSTAAISILGYEKNNPVILSWNDTGHLEKNIPLNS